MILHYVGLILVTASLIPSIVYGKMTLPSCGNLDASNSAISTLFTNFLSIVVGKQCEFGTVSYPRDRTDDILSNHRHDIDFIVVGGGSSGSVIASRLSEVWNVLLIEAGEDPTPSSYVPSMALSLQKTSIDWKYVSEKQSGVCEGLQNNVCNVPRGKALGGSSNLNLMMHVVGNPKDYNSWGSPEWSFRNFEKYFHKSFKDLYSVDFANRSHYFNTYGMIKTIVDASKELHLDELKYTNGNINPNKVGTLHIKTTIRDGERLNTAKAFLAPVKDRPKLFLMKNTIVTKILLENQKATGVQILKDEKYYEIKFNKELILSAGTVNTPKLLFQSGIGDEKLLKQEGVEVKHHLPSVGKYLYDHPMFMLPIALNISSSAKRTEKFGKTSPDNDNSKPNKDCNKDCDKKCDSTDTINNETKVKSRKTKRKVREVDNQNDFDETDAEQESERSQRGDKNFNKENQENNDDELRKMVDERMGGPPPGDEVYNYIMTKTGSLSGISLGDHITFLDTTEKNPNAPDVMWGYTYFPQEEKKSELVTLRNILNWNDTMMAPLLDHPSDLLVILPMLLQPKSHGKITFTKNVQDNPKIFLNYFNEKEDFIPFIKSVRFAEKLVETNAFQKYDAKLLHVPDSYCDELFTPNSDDFWMCSMKRRVTSYYHLTSTCKMGHNILSSVVNYKLQVHGLQNVRVADASVMPYLVRANIHATCVAIAEKAADLIKKEWA